MFLTSALHKPYLNFPSGNLTISMWSTIQNRNAPIFFIGKSTGGGLKPKWIVHFGSPTGKALATVCCGIGCRLFSAAGKSGIVPPSIAIASRSSVLLAATAAGKVRFLRRATSPPHLTRFHFVQRTTTPPHDNRGGRFRKRWLLQLLITHGNENPSETSFAPI